MKWFCMTALLLCCVSAQAQWIDAGNGNPNATPHHRGMRHSFRATHEALSVPTGIPNWPFPNIDVTNDPDNDQAEPSVTVDPLDSTRIVIGGVDDRNYNILWVYTSSDTGHTWSNAPLPEGPYDMGTDSFIYATDPGVTFDANGQLYFSNVFYNDPGPNEEACYRSTNNGARWETPVFVDGDPIDGDSEADRDYIATDRDPASPYFGRVYIAWVEIVYPYEHVVESFSTDRGNSWSKPTPVSPVAGLFEGPIPACAPNGDLYIAYENRDSTSREIIVARSTDGGQSFDPQVVVQPYRDLGPEVPNTFDGYPVIKGMVEVNSFPVIAVDRSTAHPGRIYVTWCGRDADSGAHVYLSASNDRGQTWSQPIAIEEDSSVTPTDKFFPWLAIDPTNGDVGVEFYDSRNDPAHNILIDSYLTLSTDGGESFQARRISDVSFDPRISRDYQLDSIIFFGDYIGMDALGGQWFPAWTDTRDGEQDIYFALVQPYAPLPVTDLSAHDTIVNGKPAVILTWQYVPETTFGFPLSNYFFVVGKDNGNTNTVDRTMLSYLDTSQSQGGEYIVTVGTGVTDPEHFRSVGDSIFFNLSGVMPLGVQVAPSLVLYPNPTTSTLTIEGAAGGITLCDPLRRVYAVGTIPQPTPSLGGGVSFDVSSLPAGVYFLSDGVNRAKFVKQ